jgi:hypothetical protein
MRTHRVRLSYGVARRRWCKGTVTPHRETGRWLAGSAFIQA